MLRIFLSVIIFFVAQWGHSEDCNYDFIGRHLIVSYIGCDSQALCAEGVLEAKMLEAAKASGLSVLSTSSYKFEPQGMTQVLLLSESHASIHTYPEHNACFVDLFTCGTSADNDSFQKILANYLQPEKVEARLISRGEGIEELTLKSRKY
ncbi:MAG: S-adenosylmethionine decarboxylase proenzyme [Chlamydiae bacterium]|nr:S-adenosylmethionine decarboxylase proenzyme [Chlamydiota bacterium]